ncbi:MAG TPA: hypothetical protein PK466_07210 [Thermotogota bacterium]|nr:hypothetical protein [Thermotogota bacterium]HPJ89074.1 hypothetical protein [Thermotogota bacterium]HPR96101.1 hypothetical protein [Thermotogota bacterium]
MKRWIIRLLLVVAIILLSIFLYTIGKQHTLLIDNKTVAIAEKEYTQQEIMNVYLDGGEKIEIKAKKRKSVDVVGPNHKIVVEILDGDKNIIRTEEFTFNLKTGDAKMIVNVPALLGGAKEWITADE